MSFARYLDIYVDYPSNDEGYVAQTEAITPHECRLRDLTYAAPIYVDIEYIRGSQKVRRSKLPIGRMPIMLRSSRCILTRLDTEEAMAKVKECPHGECSCMTKTTIGITASLDPGGYFVIRGAEKVVLMMEQGCKNRIMVNYNAKKELVCEILSVTTERKSKTNIINKKKKYYLKHNQLTEDMPVVVVFKVRCLYMLTSSYP